MTMNGTPAIPELSERTADLGCGRDILDIESEMTTLDGLITALKMVRWSEDLALSIEGPGVEYAEAAAYKLDGALQGLFAVIDATVAQAERLHRAVHGEAEEEKAEECANSEAEEFEPRNDAEARQLQALLGLSNLRDADVAALGKQGREVLTSHYNRLMHALDAAEEAEESAERGEESRRCP
jgi:hypothetical protein